MSHVVSVRPTPFRAASGAFEVHQIPAAHDNLVWLLICSATGATAVIDGPEAGPVLDYTNEHGLHLTHVLNTHTHGDHIGINRDLARRGLLASLEVIGARRAPEPVPGLTQAVDEGDQFTLGKLRLRVMLTEGHIYGHLCFLVDEVLFCGDTLFAGGCGRVFTGDYAAMFDSLSRLRTLDGDTRVCCAHEYTLDNLRFAASVEPENQALRERLSQVEAARSQGLSCVPSRLAEERATNPMLRWDAPSLVAQLRALSPEPELTTPLEIFTATRKLKDSGRYKRA